MQPFLSRSQVQARVYRSAEQSQCVCCLKQGGCCGNCARCRAVRAIYAQALVGCDRAMHPRKRHKVGQQLRAGAPGRSQRRLQDSSRSSSCWELRSAHDAVAHSVYYGFMMFSSSSGSGKKPPPSQVRAVSPAMSREVPTDITCRLQEMVQVGTCAPPPQESQGTPKVNVRYATRVITLTAISSSCRPLRVS